MGKARPCTDWTCFSLDHLYLFRNRDRDRSPRKERDRDRDRDRRDRERRHRDRDKGDRERREVRLFLHISYFIVVFDSLQTTTLLPAGKPRKGLKLAQQI